MANRTWNTFRAEPETHLAVVAGCIAVLSLALYFGACAAPDVPEPLDQQAPTSPTSDLSGVGACTETRPQLSR